MPTIREHKGKSLLQFPDNYTVIDLETTGLDPMRDEIIEISALKIHNNEVTATFDTLINPGFTISNFIVELTGITNEMLAQAPQLETVLPKLCEFIGDDIILGHNINFDINFLYDNILDTLDVYLHNNFVDTLRLSRRILPKLKHHRLCDISKELEVINENAHRALSDCYTTFQCYQKLRERLKKDYRNEDEFLVRNGTHNYCDLRTIHSDKCTFDDTHPLYKKVCVFTGTLDRMTRSEAAQLVVDVGGICENNVTKNTNLLILGNNDYCPTIIDGKSSKQKKAEAYKLRGLDIEIISESVFYDFLSREVID